MTCGPGPADAVIDSGGGASVLARCLLDEGYRDLAVLDVSPRGLAAELGPGFAVEEACLRDHTTPAGASQQFRYVRFARVG